MRDSGEADVCQATSSGFTVAGVCLSLLAFDLSFERYGGLSGLNALLVGRLARRWFRTGGRLGGCGLALFATATGKFSLDLARLTGPVVEFDFIAVAPSYLSHWLGLFWGLVLPVSALAERPGGNGRSCCVAGGEFASSRSLHERL